MCFHYSPDSLPRGTPALTRLLTFYLMPAAFVRPRPGISSLPPPNGVLAHPKQIQAGRAKGGYGYVAKSQWFATGGGRARRKMWRGRGVGWGWKTWVIGLVLVVVVVRKSGEEVPRYRLWSRERSTLQAMGLDLTLISSCPASGRSA